MESAVKDVGPLPGGKKRKFSKIEKIVLKHAQECWQHCQEVSSRNTKFYYFFHNFFVKVFEVTRNGLHKTSEQNFTYKSNMHYWFVIIFVVLYHISRNIGHLAA